MYPNDLGNEQKLKRKNMQLAIVCSVVALIGFLWPLLYMVAV
ncbi:MAG TPA: hypothetical protein VFV48_03330 [Pseudomonadales bacterium]|nr:hypothetical protein [Pseudomonadales bacterium]